MGADASNLLIQKGDLGVGEGNGPGKPPSTLRSQRTCLLGSGVVVVVLVGVVGTRVVVEDVVLGLTGVEVDDVVEMVEWLGMGLGRW